MELNKEILQTFVREAHVRDFESHSDEPTVMHRIDYEMREDDPHIFEFKLTFMFGHFCTQVDGVIESTLLIQADSEINILEEINANEALFAIPLYAKASALVTKLSEDRGQFPIIVPIEMWLDQ